MGASAQTIWVFPYFMERQVVGVRGNMRMSDYRVTYRDHKQYGEAEVAGLRLGSPVR